MDITLRILHIDGSIEIKQIIGFEFEDGWDDSTSVSSAIAVIGSKMRKKDLTISAIRNDKNKGTWVGKQSINQARAKTIAERENPGW